MNPATSRISRVLALPRLWWRAKGFGIHSPAAYEYVRSVVGERCRYYAYDEADRLAREAGMCRRVARLIMRAALWEGSAVAICAATRKGVAEMTTLWSHEAKVAESNWPPECSMMVAGAEKRANDAVFKAVERIMGGGGTIVLLDVDKRCGASAEVLERLMRSDDRAGVLMTDGRTALVYVRKGVPAQYYEMRL